MASQSATGSLADRIEAAKLPKAWPAAWDGKDGLDFVALAHEAVRAGHDDAQPLLEKPGVRRVISSIGNGSPFLSGLVRRDPGRLISLLKAPPDARIHELLSEFLEAEAACEPTTNGLKELSAKARTLKAEAALLIALADMGQVWPLETVTRALSDLADTTLAAGLRLLFRIAIAKGQWQDDTNSNPNSGSTAGPESDSGYFVLAMGKHGARELNYSSDIDLIVLYDRARCRLADRSEAQGFFVRMTQELVRYMSNRTSDGYVFRTDLRLRPDPGATQVAMSTDSAAHYYESFGQNWERAALIKARVVAGDFDSGNAFLRELAPFIWRKYLDYAAIADIHAMKRQIHAHRGFSEVAVAGHDIKVGRGGIREVEFFVQTQQLIAGGRQTDLRGSGTLSTLRQLAERNWITSKAVEQLTEAYEFLRGVEHRLQMVADEQTQRLPSDSAELERFARFCGYQDSSEFGAALRLQLATVQRHYVRLFEDVPTLSTGHSNLVFAGEDDDPATIESLAAMGFAEASRVIGIVRAWHRGRYKAMASKPARERLTEMTPVLLQAFAETVDPDAALIGFDRMLSQLPAGVQLFSLLHANPSLLRLIADITGSAPRLARILARRRQVIDAVLDPRVMGEALPSRDALAAVVDEQLGQAASLEDALDIARVIGSEQAFVVGARILSRTIAADQAGIAYAQLAEVLIAALLDVVRKDFEATYGKVPFGAAAVLAMGKLGGREMTAASDLDLIVVYKAAADAKQSDGAKELAVGQYYARMTQRLIAALSAPTAEGQLFEVDLRLRPSGQKGPVATHIDSFRNYQKSEAWTWEHMALTRARVVAGPADFVAEIEAVIGEVLTGHRDRAKTAADVRDMRVRIAAEKGSDDLWDLKQVRGGLVDLEFIAQFLQIVHAERLPQVLDQTTRQALVKLDSAGLLGEHGPNLIAAADLLHEMTQILRLCFDGTFAPDKAPDGLKQLLADVAGLPTFDRLQSHLRDVLTSVHRAFDELVI